MQTDGDGTTSTFVFQLAVGAAGDPTIIPVPIFVSVLRLSPFAKKSTVPARGEALNTLTAALPAGVLYFGSMKSISAVVCADASPAAITAYFVLAVRVKVVAAKTVFRVPDWKSAKVCGPAGSA